MKEDDIKAKLNAARQKVHRVDKVVPIDIMATVRVGGEGAVYQYLSTVEVKETGEQFVVLYNQLPKMYETKPENSFGNNVLKLQPHKPVIGTITEALQEYNQFIKTFGAPVVPFHFLYAFCKSRKVDIVELGLF